MVDPGDDAKFREGPDAMVLVDAAAVAAAVVAVAAAAAGAAAAAVAAGESSQPPCVALLPLFHRAAAHGCPAIPAGAP